MAIPSKNSDLYRRLRLYGFGFLLGLLIVSFLYKGKGCQMPGSAKLEELGWQKLEYSKHGACRMECRHINGAEIRELLGTGAVQGKGKVNYDKSKVQDKPYPTYAIEGTTAAGKDLRIVIADCDTISRIVTVIDLKNDADSCDCE
ncbi:MAG TPA: DUF4258 domain-containing protein [Bacteroidia bacterium]|jgi:hypothetical protein